MDDEEYLEHAGRPHEGFTPHSGRYKYGSGDDAYQRNIDFIGTVKSLKKDGLTEAQIAQGMGITVNQLRARVSISNDAVKAANISRAMMLKEKGMSATAIGKDIAGYGGPVPLEIRLKDGRVAGVKALANTETPDFFDKAKSLLTRWDGKTIEEAEAQKVDAVSGATFSSQAIIGNVRRGLQFA